MEIADTAKRLVETAVNRAGDSRRFVIALAGPPGAGKSTLSEALVAEFSRRGQGAAIVPMDGFHYDNSVLEGRGMLARKGAPFTFDVDGYSALLTRIRERPDTEIAVPVFDRALDLARAGGAVIAPEHRFVIAEGNYLLLDQPDWAQMAELFDLTVMLKADMAELSRRLIKRWLDLGLDAEQARSRAMINDIPNAETVVAGSAKADLEIASGS